MNAQLVAFENSLKNKSSQGQHQLFGFSGANYVRLFQFHYIKSLLISKCVRMTSVLQSALRFQPMRIVSVVLIWDTWEICLVFCEQIPDQKILKLSLA